MKNSAEYAKGDSHNAVEFSKGTNNAKLSKIVEYDNVYYFDLPSGHSCPFANTCKAKADRYTGKMTYGKNATIICYASSGESYKKALRDKLWRNYDKLMYLKTTEAMFLELDNGFRDSVSMNVDCVRIHTGGDFFNERYFLAWVEMAKKYSDVFFYAYTKSIPYWVNNIDKVPDNMRLTASYGGTMDKLIKQYDLNNVTVYKTIQDIDNEYLPIDYTETNPINGVKEFGLIVHGRQFKKEKIGV